MGPRPTSACITAIAVCGFASHYSWVAWPLMAALLWVICGRDPLWIVAATATWLRGCIIWLWTATRGGIRFANRTMRAAQGVAHRQAYRVTIEDGHVSIHT